MNIAAISGRITAEPEIRQSKPNEQGQTTTYMRFTVAVSSGKDQADFINCTAYGKSAEFIHMYFHKGSRIEVKGSLRQNRWQDKEGNNRSEIVLKADAVGFGETKAEADARAADSTPVQKPEAACYTPPDVDAPNFEEYSGDDGLPF